MILRNLLYMMLEFDNSAVIYGLIVLLAREEKEKPNVFIKKKKKNYLEWIVKKL